MAVDTSLDASVTSTAIASSTWESEGYEADKAVDGSLATRWNSASTDHDGSWMGVRFSASQTFTGVAITEAFNRIGSYKIQYCTEDTCSGDSTWTDIAGASGDTLPPDAVTTISWTVPVSASAIRIFVIAVNPADPYEPSLWEFVPLR